MRPLTGNWLLRFRTSMKQRYASLSRPEHAAVHVSHGSELVSQGLFYQQRVNFASHLARFSQCGEPTRAWPSY